MREFLTSTPAQAVIWTTVLLVLLMVGYYLVTSFRNRSGEDSLTANEMLTNFREMHDEGEISKDEFRTIKTVLGAKLNNELSSSGDED